MPRKYVGADGALYDDDYERVQADARWRQQQKQNELIEEQNNLIKQHMKEQSQQQFKQHIDELQENQRKRNHEENMRLLELCDNIGISKNLIDKYSGNIGSIGMTKEEQEKYNSLKKKIKDMGEERRNAEINNKSIESEISMLNNPNDIIDISNPNGIRKNPDYYKKYIEENPEDEELIRLSNKKDTYLFLVPLTSVLVGICLFIGPLAIMGAVLLIIAITLIRNKIIYNQIVNHIVDNYLKNELLELEKVLDLSDEEFDSIEEKMENESFDIYDKGVQHSLDKLYSFRLNHYNSEIEKLLLDFEFDSRFDAEYKMITKSNAKGTGTIDDYVEFFTKEIDKINK